MNITIKLKKIVTAIVILGVFIFVGTINVHADENVLKSGVYQIENDVYHESETGMAMSRTYLLPTMEVEYTNNHIIYTIGFSGSEYMENYRMKVNGEEVPVEIVEDNNEEGNVKLKVEVDKIDADMDALIYVGPMERDVEFKVIPKIDTLNLIEEIEEVEVITESESNTVTDNEDSSEIKKSTSIGVNEIVIGGVILIIVIGLIIVVGSKKKKLAKK